MQFTITDKKRLAETITKLDVLVPHIAQKAKPGQFVIVRVHEKGERIPLTIAAKDQSAGTITLVVQAIGKSTQMLCELNVGDAILDVVGPLGKATHIEKWGRVAAVGGGVGTAVLWHILDGIKKAGNTVISILGARNKDLVILENEIRDLSDELIMMTDDGTYGEKGLVTDALLKLIQFGEPLNMVCAVGPVPMMRAVSNITKEHNIPTLVSLNPIMVDGTGMCGGCRVEIDGKPQFACVDGPEFDGHLVDWDLLMKRLGSYKECELQSIKIRSSKEAVK